MYRSVYEPFLLCVVCLIMFRICSAIDLYIIYIIGETKSKYACKSCGFRAQCRSQLARHSKIHVRYDEVRPFFCKICNRNFKNVNQLQNHINFHTGVK